MSGAKLVMDEIQIKKQTIRGDIGMTLDQFLMRLNEFLFMVNNPKSHIDDVWKKCKAEYVNDTCKKFPKLKNFKPIRSIIALSPYRHHFHDVLAIEGYQELTDNQELFNQMPDMHPQKIKILEETRKPVQYELMLY